MTHTKASKLLAQRTFLLAPMLAIALVSTGCTSLLKADFESLSNSETPVNGALLGNPTGDSFGLALAFIIREAFQM